MATDAASNLSPYSNTASATTTGDRADRPGRAYAFNEGTGTAVADASALAMRVRSAGPPGSPTGKYGSALVFNGSQLLASPSRDSPSLRLTTAMTLEAWVYPAVNNAGWRDVIYKGDDNYYLEGTSGNGGTRAVAGTFDGPQSDVGDRGVCRSTPGRTSRVTYDKATLRLYVNGTQVGESRGDAPTSRPPKPAQIGGDSIYGQYFNGRIDEVRIYNRAPLRHRSTRPT